MQERDDGFINAGDIKTKKISISGKGFIDDDGDEDELLSARPMPNKA